MDDFPLYTSRLMLRRFILTDLPAMISYRNQPDVARYQSWSSFTTEDAMAFFKKQDQLIFDTNETWFQIAIIRQQDATLLGDLALHFFDNGRQVELGITFDTSYQRKGYATEAISRIIEFLFNKLNKHRLVATVDVRNEPAQRLLERLGFRREAHFKENIFFKGAWADEYNYALLNSEWHNNSR